MEAIAGIFGSPEQAQAAAEDLRWRGVEGGRVTLLMPEERERDLEERVPTDDGEQRGMGGALGGVVGGAIGLATANLVLPGVGPIVVAGVLAAGMAGAAAGGVVGDDIERRLTMGLPHDELGVYSAALRDGRTVVIAGADSDMDAELIRETLRLAGAESVDPAREDWLVGLRDDAGRKADRRVSRPG